MNEEQQFKQAALTAGMLNLKEEFDNRFRKVVEDWQNAVAALLLNVDETWRAKNEVSWFETIHDNKAGHKVWDGEPVLEVKGAPFDEKLGRPKRWEDPRIALREAVKNNVPKPRSEGTKIVFDWSKATLEDLLPVDWTPEIGQRYWYIADKGVLGFTYTIYDNSETLRSCGRLFPTAALAQQYLDSQKPVERWKPEVNKWYWKLRETGTPLQFKWAGTKVDWDYYHFGNIFRTEQEALAARDRVKKALKGE